jgi:outer membrane lipoprotein SlyB
MKSIASVVLSIALATSVVTVSGCTNRDLGTTGGAALGGLAGYGLTGGSGIGAAVGAVGGGFLGNSVSR